MSEAFLAACWTGYAALLIWLPVRAFNRLESWEAAVAVLVVAGGIGGAMIFYLSQILTGCR